MIPDLPPNPRAELEARITAWLLGELSSDEASAIRQQVENDPELSKLRDRLSRTLNLLRETVATPMGETPASPTPMKLSAARREKLLAQFKTIRPVEFEKPKRGMPNLILALAAVASIAILLSLMLPSLSRAKQKAQRFASSQQLFDNLSQSAAPAVSSPAQNEKEGLSADNTKTLADLAARRQAENAPVAAPTSAGKIVLPQSASDSTFAFEIDQSKRESVQKGLPPVRAPDATVVDSITPNGTWKLALPNSRSEDKGVALNFGPEITTGNTSAFESGKFDANKTSPVAMPPVVTAAPAPAGISGTTTFADGFAVVNGDISLAKNTSNNGDISVNYDTKKEEPSTGFYSLSGGVLRDEAGLPAQPAKKDSDKLGWTGAPIHSPPLLGDMPATGSLVASMPTESMKTPGSEHAAERMVRRKLGSNDRENAFGGGGGAGGNNSSAYLSTNAVTTYASADAAKIRPATIPIQHAKATDIAAALQSLGANDGSSIGHASAETKAAEKSASTATDVYTVNAVGYINVSPNTNPPIASFHFPLIEQSVDKVDAGLPRPSVPPPVPQPEVLTSVNAFTTFSLNISDVAFKLTEASLQNGQIPDAASLRSEEFINAFDYRDPEPAPGAPIGFAWERAGDPFTHNRDFLRFSVKTAAQGRQAGRPLNIVLLLDKSGSMERADRVEIISQALKVVASQLQPNDTLSIVVFARTARLFADGVPGSQAGSLASELRSIQPEGGTNLEEAMRLAYQTALRHYLANGENRVVLLTDGAANLGSVEPTQLKRSVESNRKQGIALDCFGVGWDGYNDPLLETLSRAGNGRYGFINTPEEAATEFAGKLAGALRVAAADVKVQVEFNPDRVAAYRQIGYAKDQLKKEDFRDNSVKAAQIGAAESGNALYTIQIKPSGDGPIGTVHVRYRVPGTENYEEHEWVVPYTGSTIPLDQASPAIRLAATAAEFSEWLAGNQYAAGVTPDLLLNYLRGVPQVYGADGRPGKLEWMIRQAKSITGK